MFSGDVEVAWCCTVKSGEVAIAFRLPAGAELAQLKQGSRVHLILEESVTQKKPPGVRTKLAALAGSWCRDPTFQQWIMTTFQVKGIGTPLNGTTAAQHATQHAAAAVRFVCRVLSRSEFDTDEAAAERFHHLIRQPYSEWLQNRTPKTFDPAREAS